MKFLVAFIAALAVAVPAFAQDTGWIGISIAEQPDRGVLVRSVEANSPAEKAGLKSNDIIVQFNKQEVVGVLQLQRLVNETPVGRSVDVLVRRDNREQLLKVTSEQAPFSAGRILVQGPHLNENLNANFNDNFTVFRDHFNTAGRPFEVITSTSVTQAGVRADSLTPQLREFFGVKAGEGVLIASVDAGSAAARAGLMAGDVVTAIDGRAISTTQDFNREVRSRTTGVTLTVVRNKQPRELRIER
jgi:serine protease Do